MARPRPTDLDETALPAVLEGLNCLRVAITVFDAQERLVYVNQHISYLFRSLPPRPELAGATFCDLLRLVLAGGEIAATETLGSAERFVERFGTHFRDGDRRPHDLPLADGRIVELKTRRISGGGWITLWSDVTEARRVLGRLEHAIALSADSFAFYDREDRLVLCNDDYAAAHSAQSPHELVGKSFLELAVILSKNGRLANTTDDWLERRIAVHRQSAGVMTLDTSAGVTYLLRDRATSDGGRVVVLTDITEHRRVEKALAEQTRALDSTRRALARTKAEAEKQSSYLADLANKLDETAASVDSTKMTFLRTMSHELKTPLNAIIGFSDLLITLADRQTPAEVKEYAGLINLGGKNLLRMLNQILDLTKISAGRFPLRRQRLDAGMALCQACDTVDGRAAERSIKIDTSGCPTGVLVDADDNALSVMLGHLVENAVMFNREGGEVRLTVAKQDRRVRLTVADNGPGVDSVDIDRIQLPFEQAGRGTTDHTHGAGLGLTLVKALAELHGGALVLESAKGAGFAAHLDLPAG